MKVRYAGESFGAAGLTDGKVYECLGVEQADILFLRVIDDSEEDYIYPAYDPGPFDGSTSGGKWEIVEDDESGTLRKALQL